MGLREFSKWTNQLVDMGRYGVISFFVLSALTLSMSIAGAQSQPGGFSYFGYLRRRIARIFPMYFVAMLFFWSIGGAPVYLELYKVEPRSFVDLFMHLSFLNLWVLKYKNTIAGVEWTIPIEMWAYLLIPTLFFAMKRTGVFLRLIVFLATIALSLIAVKWHKDEISYHWAFEKYLYCFVAGILVYFYWGQRWLSQRWADALVVIFLLFLTFMVSFDPYKELLITLGFAGLAWSLSRAQYTKKIFENSAIIFFGNISFSFYLIHLPILEFLRSLNLPSLEVGLIGFVATTGLAFLTYKFIEQPCMERFSRARH
jgi:peptidoglycan/LPS O-acetylase OafA/YrhL